MTLDDIQVLLLVIVLPIATAISKAWYDRKQVELEERKADSSLNLERAEADKNSEALRNDQLNAYQKLFDMLVSRDIQVIELRHKILELELAVKKIPTLEEELKNKSELREQIARELDTERKARLKIAEDLASERKLRRKAEMRVNELEMDRSSLREEVSILRKRVDEIENKSLSTSVKENSNGTILERCDDCIDNASNNDSSDELHQLSGESSSDSSASTDKTSETAPEHGAGSDSRSTDSREDQSS